MVKGILLQILLKVALAALVVLVLYGVIPDLAIILILFVGWRFTALVAEALRKPVSAEHWAIHRAALTRTLETLTPEELSGRAEDLNLDPRASPAEIAQAQIAETIPANVPLRSKRELCADALGVLAFALLIPVDVALYTKDIFSLRASQHWGWDGAIVAALSLAVYAWPYRSFKSPDQADLRIWWWTLPFALSLLAMTHAVHTRHPYLNPFNPDRDRLAAERVLSLKNNVVAGAYADWVLRYARDLDQQGDTRGAIHYYREALRLNPTYRDAYARLATLENQAAASPGDNGTSSAPNPAAPYWTAGSPVTPPPRRHIDAQLENVEGCTVVIVPVGEVPGTLLDAVGYVIHHELDLPVYVSPDAVPLPPHTRVRGLATGPQWNVASLVQAVTNSITVFPRAPVKYLIVTPVDIYIEDANYVFSGTGPWGAVLSFARFGGPNGDDPLLLQRTAKQSLGALLKSFNIPASTDRNDVTSYTSSLGEFDAKGGRPNAETLKLFRQAVADINRKWQNYRAKQRG